MADKNNSKPISFLFAVLAAVLILTGCVERKLTINTQPAGGLVFLNDEEIGVSPVTVGFSWYGDYKVRISKKGYETLNTHRNLPSPLHDHFPLDFFAELLWPWRIADEYEWTFELLPYQPPQRDELISAAKQMKERAAAEIKKSMETLPED